MEQAGTKEFSRLMTKTTQEKDLTPDASRETCPPPKFPQGWKFLDPSAYLLLCVASLL